MRLLILLLVMIFFIYGCGYSLRYMYPAPIPTKNNYILDDIHIHIISDEARFHALEEVITGEKSEECVAFVDPLTMKDIYILRKPDGSIELDWLGHEIYYHVMEGWHGHSKE